jgi:hypothetical protein
MTVSGMTAVANCLLSLKGVQSLVAFDPASVCCAGLRHCKRGSLDEGCARRLDHSRPDVVVVAVVF